MLCGQRLEGDGLGQRSTLSTATALVMLP